MNAMTPMQSTRFDIRRTLGAGGMGVVYEALDTQSQRLVALKTLHEVSPQGVYRLKQEFRALADIQHPGLVQLDELHCEDGRWFFTMELVVGQPFQDWVSDWAPTAAEPTMELTGTSTLTGVVPGNAPDGAAQFDEQRLRKTATQLVEALHHLHQLGRVHCDVKSSNVLVTDDGRVVLMDFGLIRGFGDESGATEGRLEGSIATMAPEQATGAKLGPPADFYAVGAMLYAGLTGQMPYRGGAAQIIAEKQRRPPVPPSELMGGIPSDLDRLAVQLLDPEPGRRPAAEAILQVLAAAPTLELELQPTVREQFFGRVNELAHLKTVYDRAQTDLTGLLVRGEAGLGKSALVAEFLQSLRNQAVVLRSRCHAQEAVPLNALDGIVDGLSHHLLSLSAVDAALLMPADIGPLVAAFPVLARVPVVNRAMTAAPTRGNDFARAAAALHSVLSAMSRRAPLVLFIDDLQWVDDASLAFLAELLAVGPWPTTLLATARPTAPERDPLRRLGKASPEWALHFEVLELRGLSADDSDALLSHGWDQLSDAHRQTLADEAGGHPLMLKELARFVASQGQAEHPAQLTDALDTRIENMKELDRVVLEAICTARIGLDLDLLAACIERPKVDCALAAQRLKTAQLIRVEGRVGQRTLKPYHDRVRETIEARQLDASGTEQLHARLAEALANKTSSTNWPVLYAAATHYGFADAALRDEQRIAAAELMRRAAEGAQWVNDQSRCLDFTEAAMRVLGDRDDSLQFELSLIELQAMYRNGAYQLAERQFELRSQATTEPARIRALYTCSARMLQRVGKDDEASDRMRQGLSRLGLHFSANPGPSGMLLQLAKTRWALRGIGPAQVAALPLCTEQATIETMHLTSMYGSMAYREGSELIGTMTFRTMELLVQDGLTPASTAALGGYALVVGGVFERWHECAEWVACAREVEARTKLPDNRKPWVYAILGGFPMAMVRPISESRALLEEAIQIGPEHVLDSLLIRLLQLDQERALGPSLQGVRDTASVLLTEGVRSNMQDWMRSAELSKCACDFLEGKLDDPRAVLQQLDPSNIPEAKVARVTYSNARFQLETHFGHPRAAWEAAQQGRTYWEDVICTLAQMVICFAEAVSAARLLPQASWMETPQLHFTIRRALKFLDGLADVCPENFAARAAVAHAEVHQTPVHVARAIAAATENDDRHMLGWALELAGRMDEAADAWEQYGATAKAAQLRE